MSEPVHVGVRGLDHVVIKVADVEASLEFYRDLLGLEVLRNDQYRAGEVPFVSLRVSEGSIIDLFEGAPTGENVDHISLWVDGDLDAIVASGSFDVVRPPRDIFGAQGQGPGMYVRDPDGNLVEFKTYW